MYISRPFPFHRAAKGREVFFDKADEIERIVLDASYSLRMDQSPGNGVEDLLERHIEIVVGGCKFAPFERQIRRVGNKVSMQEWARWKLLGVSGSCG